MNIDWLHLKQLSKMETPEDIKEFEEKVWALAQTKDVDILEHLIDLFDDDCPYYEVMYSLVHAIETYPDDVYVKTISRGINKYFKHHPWWTKNLIYRVINSKECVSIFRENMHLADKESLLKLFKIMEEESPHHRELIRELRAEIENSPK